MELKNEFDGRKGAYYFDQDGQRMGESTYTMAGPDKLIIDHTEVDDSLQGTGKAAQLVQAIVDHARENQLKIMPLCPFARLMFDKKGEEWADVRF
ncbi:N-acetyltransferase [Cryomorphaceae bacterium]|nr:N-acetyltransferase [Cryomorphaceae bacterium]